MKSKIKSIEQIGDFTNDHGTFYTYEYEFENGESGQAVHKTQGVDTLKNKVGDEKEFEIQTTDYGSKVKWIQVEFKPQHKGSNPEVQIVIVRQSSLERATEYFSIQGFGSNASPDHIRVMALAEIYTNFVMTGKYD